MSPNQQAATVISIKSLKKTFKKFQLGPLDLDFQQGYVYGIIGPNGAGKTTLLKILMNLTHPSSGDVRIFGLSYANDEANIKRRIGFVPEEPYLYRLVDAQWLGRFVSAYYPNWDAAVYQRLLHELNVDMRQPVHLLSRGTKVKLELAMALAHKPDLLILDEPTSGLDPIVRREILHLLSEVVQDERRTVLFSTHITEDAERVADHIVFIVDGGIALMGEREALRTQWRELIVDANDVRQLTGVIRTEDAGQGTVRVIVGEGYNGQADMQRFVINERPLALDEILAELACKKSEAII
jgi:ABC-2 type transport system ATP-binding protein